MRPLLILVTGSLLTLPAANALAHGGGLDGQGCHHNRKVGGYHCHRGPLGGQSFQSKEEATRALQQLQAPPERKPK